MSEGSPIIVSQKSIREYKPPEWLQVSERRSSGSLRIKNVNSTATTNWDIPEQGSPSSNVELRRNNSGSRSLRIPKEGVILNNASTNEKTSSTQNVHITPGLGNITRSNSKYDAPQAPPPQVLYTSEPFYPPQPIVTDSRSIATRIIPIEIEQPRLVQYEPQYYYVQQPGPVQFITHEQPSYSIIPQMPRSQSASNISQYITQDGAHVTEVHEVVPSQDGTENIEIKKRTIRRNKKIGGESIRVGGGVDSNLALSSQRPLLQRNNSTIEQMSYKNLNNNRSNEEIIELIQDLLNKYKDRSQDSEDLARPIRTHSQTNILNQPTRMPNNWTSETNIRANIGKTGYSAHRENAQNEVMSQTQNRESYMTRNIGDGKYYEELEVITLQPIGKGVQDLHSGSFISTLPRSGGEMNVVESRSLNNLVNISAPAHKTIFNEASIKNKTVDGPLINNGSQYIKAQASANQNSGNAFSTMSNFKRSMSFNTALPRNQSQFNGQENSEFRTMMYNPGKVDMNASRSGVSTLNLVQYAKGVAPNLSNDKLEGFRSGQQSPSISNYNRQKFSYESTTDVRSRMGTTSKNFISPQISVSNQNAGLYATNMSGMETDMAQETEVGLRAAYDTQNSWYKPDFSRDEVIEMLKSEEPGRFIIRKSTTFPNSYGLALKVNSIEPRLMDRSNDKSSELVRHFLIESVDGGVHLRGFADEAVFKSLANFVHHHTLQKDALPCRLKLPTVKSSGGNVHASSNVGNMSIRRDGSMNSRDFSYGRANSQIEKLDKNRGIKFDIGYLGHVVVDRLCGEAGARRGVTEILMQYEKSNLPKKCIATVEVIPGEGISINDFSRRGLVKKFIKATDVEWIGFDPELRTYSDQRLTSLSDAKILVLVAKKQKLILHENEAYVFCELNANSSKNIISFVNSNFRMI